MQALGKEGSVDWYCLLNVDPTASNDEIQKAYKLLSKTFHPDRLRAGNAAESDQAQEAFVSVKTAYEVLRDPAYRFAYDQYGHEGVRYLSLCQQVKDGGQAAQQQNLLSLDLSLHDELQKLLQNETTSGMKQRLALKLLKNAMDRYRQQLKVIRQRLQDSIFEFDAKLELPCAYHPQGAHVSGIESDNDIPYLELEAVRIDVSVRTSNQNQQQTLDKNGERSSTVPKPKRHIYSTTLGAKTNWAATGKGGAEVSLEGNYKLTPASKTTLDCEVSAPVTKVGSAIRPIKAQISSTHEFVGGTVMNIGLRGSNMSRDGLECFASSHRRLVLGGGTGGATNTGNVIAPKISASCAGGMKALSGQMLYGFVTLTTITTPQQRQQQQQQQQHRARQHDKRDETKDTLSKEPWSCSTPILSVRAGYHPTPIFASIKVEEFGKSWASLFAAWSWNVMEDYTRIKIMLSADLCGSYEDNDTTTIRTGIRHDLLSGWIWLWEWEENDWTLKVPISLSISQNTQWVALAMGLETVPTDKWHNALGSLLASCIVVKVAQTLLGEWIPNANHKKIRERSNAQTSDATFSEQDGRERQGLESGKDEVFSSLMTQMAKKKRTAELNNGVHGLVILSAKLVAREISVAFELLSSESDAANPKDEPHASLVKEAHIDLTDRLQFWVRRGKLALPPLTSQSVATPSQYYSIGGTPDGERSRKSSSFLSSSLSRLNHISQVCMKQFDTVVNWLVEAESSTALRYEEESFPYDMVIRYQYQSNVYEISFNGYEKIEIPNSEALLLGPRSTVLK